MSEDVPSEIEADDTPTVPTPTRRKRKRGLVFYRPNCVITVGGRQYRHGDSVDDWTAEDLERHADKVRKS